MKLSDAKLKRIRALDPYRARQLESENFSRAGPYIKLTTTPHTFHSIDYRDRVGLTDPPKEVVSDWKITDIGTFRKEGVYNPDWKKRLRKGEYVGSEYSVDRVSYERGLQEFAFTKWASWYNDYGQIQYGLEKFWRSGENPVTLLDPPTIPAGILDSLDRSALMSLSQKTKDAYQKISGMVLLGELRETLHMIRSPSIALRKGLSLYFDALKKRASKARSHRDLRRAVNGTYLEFTFGWQPLISDIKAGAEAFAEVLNRREHDGLRPIRSKRFNWSQEAMISHDPEYAIPYFFPPASYLLLDRKVLQKSEANVSYWSMQDFRLAQWNKPTALDSFGISLKEFVPSIWELIPWSFVVDYFTNIGDILNFESTDWSKVVDCYRQVKTATSYEVWDQLNGDRNIYVWGLYGWTDSGLSKAVKRHEVFQRSRVDIRNQHLDFEFQVIPAKYRQNFNLASLGLQLAAAKNTVYHRSLALKR